MLRPIHSGGVYWPQPSQTHHCHYYHWRGKALYIARRRVLLQSVSTSISQYWTGFQAISSSSAKQIQSAQASFLWRRSSTCGGWYPLAWDKVIQPTMEGGLGIRDISIQNQAGAAHLVWHFLLKKKKTHGGRGYSHKKYLRSNSFEHCSVKQTDSRTWKAILQHRNIILHNKKWVISPGTAVNGLTPWMRRGYPGWVG